MKKSFEKIAFKQKIIYLCKWKNINRMTTLQLNQKLFNELSVIAGDEDKMRQAVRVLHIIASGKKVKPSHRLIASDDNDEMTDKQWADYFASKPSVDLPKDTDTATFVKSCRKRTVKQMREWL